MVSKGVGMRLDNIELSSKYLPASAVERNFNMREYSIGLDTIYTREVSELQGWKKLGFLFRF